MKHSISDIIRHIRGMIQPIARLPIDDLIFFSSTSCAVLRTMRPDPNCLFHDGWINYTGDTGAPRYFTDGHPGWRVSFGLLRTGPAPGIPVRGNRYRAMLRKHAAHGIPRTAVGRTAREMVIAGNTYMA